MKDDQQTDDFLFQIQLPKVTDDHIDKLIYKITKQEIISAIGRLSGGKSPFYLKVVQNNARTSYSYTKYSPFMKRCNNCHYSQQRDQ